MFIVKKCIYSYLCQFGGEGVNTKSNNVLFAKKTHRFSAKVFKKKYYTSARRDLYANISLSSLLHHMPVFSPFFCLLPFSSAATTFLPPSETSKAPLSAAILCLHVESTFPFLPLSLLLGLLCSAMRDGTLSIGQRLLYAHFLPGNKYRQSVDKYIVYTLSITAKLSSDVQGCFATLPNQASWPREC